MSLTKWKYSVRSFIVVAILLPLSLSAEALTIEELRSLPDDTLKIYRFYEYIDSKLMEGNVYKAMEAADEAIVLCEEIKSFDQERRILDLIGASANNHGKYKQALDYYFQSKRLAEKTGNKKLLAESLNGIGIIYWYTGEMDKALKFYNEALKIARKNKDYMQAASLYNNMGMIYRQRNDFNKATDYYYQSIDLCIKGKHQSGLANSYNNLGVLYNTKKEYDKALQYFEKSLVIRKEIDDPIGITTSLGNIGSVYLYKGEYLKAEEYLRESFAVSVRLDDMEGVKENSMNLSEMFELSGRADSALKYYKIFVAVRDSLLTEETKREGLVREMEYEFEKQQELKQTEVEADKRKQRYVLFAVLVVLLVVIVFSVLLMKRFRIIRRQNRIIHDQKVLVEQKQKEILDSIRYARRIQQAQFPTTKYIDKHLGKSGK